MDVSCGRIEGENAVVREGRDTAEPSAQPDRFENVPVRAGENVLTASCPHEKSVANGSFQ